MGLFDDLPDAQSSVGLFDDLPDANRPTVALDDGSVATVRTIGVGDERGEWVVPTIVNGRAVSNDEAISLWRSGRNPAVAGPFKSIAEANDFGQKLHDSEARRVSKSGLFDDIPPAGNVSLVLSPEEQRKQLYGVRPESGMEAGTDFTKALYVDLPQDIQTGVQKVFQPIEAGGAALFNQLKLGTTPETAVTTGKMDTTPAAQPGVPMVNLPVAEDPGALGAISRFAESLTTPGNLATLPLAPSSKLLQAAFAGQAASGIPVALQRTAEDPSGAITEALLQAGMAGVMGRGALKKAPAKAAPVDSASIEPFRKVDASELQRAMMENQIKPAERKTAFDDLPEAVPTKTIGDTKPSPVMYPTDGSEVAMRKSAERATSAENFPEPVRETIKESPDSFYTRQSMKRVEDAVSSMSDGELSGVPRDSNLYTAAKLEQAQRHFDAGRNEAGYDVFVELEKEGTRLGQLINQFKLLKSANPENIVKAVNEGLRREGMDILNEQQAAKLRELSRQSIDANKAVEKAKNDWLKNPTDENAAIAEKLLTDADAFDLAIQRVVHQYQRRDPFSTTKSVLQGNLLTPISEVANIVGNMSFLPFRAAARTVATGLDVIDAYLRNRPREINVQPLAGTVEAAKGAGRGLKQIPDIALRGTGNVIKGEPRANLQPLRSWAIQFARSPDVPTRKGALPFSDRVALAIEGTFGVPAEVMLRGLGAGDAPFRNAAQARATAEQLSLAGVPRNQWAFAQRFPELFLDEKALARIADETSSAVFQRPSDTLNHMTSWLKGKGKLFDLAVTFVAPYKLTPWNIIAEILSYNPLVAIGKTLHFANKGMIREAEISAGKMAVGSMLTAAGFWLYKKGLIAPSMDQKDEAQKARVLAGQVLPPNHLNVSGLRRAIEGGDPSFKPGDHTVDVFRAGGLAGSMFYMTANIGRDFEKKPDESDAVMMSLLRNSTLEQARFGVNQSFLKGVAGVLQSVTDGSTDRFVNSMANSIVSVPLPNTLSVISRIERDYKVDPRADRLGKEIGNIVRMRLGFAGLDDYLPIKRDLWGQPMRETPEGANALIYHLFDVTKGQQVTDDAVALELYRIWRKTADTSVIPSLPTRSLTINDTTYNLTPDQYSRYAELVGKERRRIVDFLVVNPEFHKLADEYKIEQLERAYTRGLTIAKRQFVLEAGKLSQKPGRAGFNTTPTE